MRPIARQRCIIRHVLAPRACQAETEIIWGSLGANKEHLINLLGHTMYSADIVEIAVKELVQNSFDAVKANMYLQEAWDANVGMLAQKEAGDIHVQFDVDARTLTVSDNGTGMTTSVVQNAFFTIAGTDKAGLPVNLRSGGIGLAKMAFIMNSDSIKVNTVRGGKRTLVDAAVQDIKSGTFPIRVIEAPMDAHGTEICITLPKRLKIDGESRPIKFPTFASSFLFRYPLITEFDIRISETFHSTANSFPIERRPARFAGLNFPAYGTAYLATANFRWGEAHIYMSSKPSSHIYKRCILSSGLFQFYWKDAGQWHRSDMDERVPFDVVIDFHPSVDARHSLYPFNNQREGFRPTITNDLQDLASWFVQYVSMSKVAAFSNFKWMRRVKIEDITNDADNSEPWITPQDHISEWAEGHAVQITGATQGASQSAEKYTNDHTVASSFHIDLEIKRADSLTVYPDLPIFHNNTNLEITASHQPFLAKLASIVLEFKERLGNLSWSGSSRNYKVLVSPQDAYCCGISVDKTYKGVHLRAPFHAFFLNPLGCKERTPDGIVASWYNTLLHEAAHAHTSAHNEEFASLMGELYSKLADTQVDKYIKYLLLQVLRFHNQDFQNLRSIYHHTDTRNQESPMGKDCG